MTGPARRAAAGLASPARPLVVRAGRSRVPLEACFRAFPGLLRREDAGPVADPRRRIKPTVGSA